jgi:soluble lytic murein transglycosylase-like protein
MQLMPDTATRFKVRQIQDPVQNIRGGMAYLRWLLAYFEGDLALALAAYNAGEGAVEQYGNRVPPFPETQEYVKLVQQFYTLYRPPPAPAPHKGKPVLILPSRDGR